VCAAVSALAYTAAGALEELAGIRVQRKERIYEMYRSEGYTGRQKRNGENYLETVVIGLNRLNLDMENMYRFWIRRC